MIDLSQEYDVYVATEVGNYSHGGISVWVDKWISEVAPHLNTRPILILEVEQTQEWVEYAVQFVDVIHRPGSDWKWEYTMSSLPIPNYFSLPDRKTVDMIIKGAKKLHLLSYPLPILYSGNQKGLTSQEMRNTYDRDIDSICVHSRERSTLLYQRKLMKFNKESLHYQNMSIEFQELLIKESKESIWIGVEEEVDFDHNISNVYEFEHNLSAVQSNVVGFPARCEPRKNIKYLSDIESIALTNSISVEQSIKHYKSKFTLDKTHIEDYTREKVHNFFKSSEWGISHSCFKNEPFGYSIFQSVDYGKIPIIHTDWCEKMKYPFRASTVAQFKKQVAKISELSVDERNTYLGDLRDYLSKYSSTEQWRDELLHIYNK